MGGPLLFGLLITVTVLMGFVALWRLSARQDQVTARLGQYGRDSGLDTDPGEGARRRKDLRPHGLGAKLAQALSEADMPITAAEFVLAVLGGFVLGLLVGTLVRGPLVGIGLGLAFGLPPVVYLRIRQSRRRDALMQQLPDVLDLMVGALRAGYGLSQTLEMLVEQVRPPAKIEFGRVMRGVSLGQPIQRALEEMAARVGSDDLDLMVTAINVQYEMGGNLAQTLETIGQTVRDRIHMKREIRSLTAQQRMTGYVLALMPVFFAVVVAMANPGYLEPLFQGAWVALPILAIILQVLGFLVMRKIVDIEV
ncbi:MAG: type II secretion system F family protein [Anaerolineae bacterium]